ncbi:hypothetical protein IWX91DRAFT_336081 [Phyllosticta citricarpa]
MVVLRHWLLIPLFALIISESSKSDGVETSRRRCVQGKEWVRRLGGEGGCVMICSRQLKMALVEVAKRKHA